MEEEYKKELIKRINRICNTRLERVYAQIIIRMHNYKQQIRTDNPDIADIAEAYEAIVEQEFQKEEHDE